MTEVDTIKNVIRNRLKYNLDKDKLQMNVDTIKLYVNELRFIYFLNEKEINEDRILRVICSLSTKGVLYREWCTWYEEFTNKTKLDIIPTLIKNPQGRLEKLFNWYYEQLEKYIKRLVKEKWNNIYLSQLVTITSGLTRNTPYNFKLYSTMKNLYPNLCCHCFIDTYDLENDIERPKETPILLWLTEKHEPNCKERPCPLANLNIYILKLIWSFVVDKEKLIEESFKSF